MKLFRYGLLYLFSVVFLAACGGGGSTPAATVSPPPPPPVTNTGIFLDSAVEGLTYQSGSNPPGTTDANGTFIYTPGETLTFSVGGVVLGTLPDGAAVITPSDFGAAAEINIARFLQTLDADGDPSNGIDLTAAAIALEGTVLDDAVFVSDATTFEIAIAPALEVALGPGVALIDEVTAVANLVAATDTTFDVAELAGRVFVAVFPGEDDFGVMNFAPLLDPGDLGSTVETMLRNDTLEAGGDGTVTVDDWSVDNSGVLTITNPNEPGPITVEKMGGSARAISIVVTDGTEEIVGTLLVPTTVNVAALAGESGKTYAIELFGLPADELDEENIIVTFYPNGILAEPDGPDLFLQSWEIDPNGVFITVVEEEFPDEASIVVLVNGSFASGGDLLIVDTTTLSGDPTVQIDLMLEGTLTLVSTTTPAVPISYNFASGVLSSGDPALTALFAGLSVSGTFDYDNVTAPRLVVGEGSVIGSVLYIETMTNLVGSVDGMNFSDLIGLVLVGNDRFVPGGLTDFFAVDADPGLNSSAPPEAFNLVGFEINGFTLVNVRMFWIEGQLGIMDFLSNEALPTVLPGFEGRLALDFTPTANPGVVSSVFFDGLIVGPSP